MQTTSQTTNNSLSFLDNIYGFLREPDGTYSAKNISETDVLKMASLIAAQKINNRVCIDSPKKATELIQFKMGKPEHEVFACLFLDTKHNVIAYETLFYGTVDGASVYPRVVVKRALVNNAAACIIAHNHPSGDPEPSQADKNITKRLQEALALIDIRVLDHLIVGHTTYSFAENNLL